MEISNDIFESLIKCKYKAYLKLTGGKGCKPAYEIIQLELRDKHKNELLKNILSVSTENKIIKTPDLTLPTLKNGYRIILDTHITHNGKLSYFNALERTLGKSNLGSFHYMPVLFIEKEKISKADKLLLAFNGLLLGNLQKKQPEHGKIIYGQFRTTKIKLDKQIDKVKHLISAFKESFQDGKSPRLLLNSHCKICEFKDFCRNKAVEKDDLSLLTGITEKEILKQNTKGIFTVTQYSYTFHLRKRRKIDLNSPKPKLFELKALSIRENRIHVYERPQLPFSENQIYLDIEGDPGRGFNYLIGLVITKNSIEKRYSFWADNENEETFIFKQFLCILEKYSNFKLFHYGSYERKFLKRMRNKIEEKYSCLIDEILKHSVNILSVIYSHVYFPTYSNELKDIGSYIGFKWTDANASGIQSLVWRKRWEMSRDEWGVVKCF